MKLKFKDAYHNFLKTINVGDLSSKELDLKEIMRGLPKLADYSRRYMCPPGRTMKLKDGKQWLVSRVKNFARCQRRENFSL